MLQKFLEQMEHRSLLLSDKLKVSWCPGHCSMVFCSKQLYYHHYILPWETHQAVSGQEGFLLTLLELHR